MKEFIIWSSETVYYKTIVKANSVEEASTKFYEHGEEPGVIPYRSDFWQVDDITEVENEENAA